MNNHKYMFRSSTLLYACKNKEIDKINSILNNKPSKSALSCKSKKNCTPLYYLCKNGLEDIAIRLIKEHTIDCDFTAQTIHGFTAFVCACVQNLKKVIIEMLKYYPIIACGLDKVIMPPITYNLIQWRTTPLIYLCHTKQYSIVTHILQYYSSSCGLDILLLQNGNMQNSNDSYHVLNALLLVCENNNEELINYILNNHYNYSGLASVNNPNEEYACIRIIKTLIVNNHINFINTIIKKGLLNALYYEHITDIFEFTCINNCYSILNELVSYIPLKPVYIPIQESCGKKSSNETDALEDNIKQVEYYTYKTSLRKILMLAVTFGDDNLVANILDKYKTVCTTFKECAYCFEFNNDVSNGSPNYYFTSHNIEDLPCAYDTGEQNIPGELSMPTYTNHTGFIQKICERKLAKSLSSYATNYELSFSQFVLDKYKLHPDNIAYTTVLIECIKAPVLNDMAKKIINTYTNKDINMGLLDYISEGSKTPLMFAIENKQEEIALLLICNHFKQCNVFNIDDDGNTAMILACIHKLEKVALELLNYYKDKECKEFIMLSHVNKFHKSAMLIAMENNMTSVTSIIGEFHDQQVLYRELELQNKERALTSESMKLVQKEMSLKTLEDDFNTKKSTLATKESTIKTKENSLKTKENALKIKETSFATKQNELCTKETEFEKKVKTFTTRETESANDNTCAICFGDVYSTYITRPCNHIVKLCTVCHPSYVKMAGCSACRKPFTLEKCFAL